MKNENLIYGLRPLIEAIESGKEIDKILLQKGLQGEIYHQLKPIIKDNNIPFQYVPVEKLNRITRKNHQGVIAWISGVEYKDLDFIISSLYEKGKTPLFLVLDRITDVRNFGAIARTAECAGVQAIIVPARESAQINADAIKTSAGALHSLDIHRSFNLKTTIENLQQNGIKVVACTEKTNKLIHDADLSGPLAIVMGSEENGVSETYIEMADSAVKIPMSGRIESLNVSVATGIIVYEAVRQRNL